MSEQERRERLAESVAAARELLGLIESEDGPDPEPDKQIEHSCGHIWGYASHDEPTADQPCWRCQPCPCCGEKMWDCTCEPGDPFADYDSEGEG